MGRAVADGRAAPDAAQRRSPSERGVEVLLGPAFLCSAGLAGCGFALVPDFRCMRVADTHMTGFWHPDTHMAGIWHHFTHLAGFRHQGIRDKLSVVSYQQ